MKLTHHLLVILLFLATINIASGQNKYEQTFDEKLNSAGIAMAIPPGFCVVHPVQNPVMRYDFGIRSMYTSFEAWFRVLNTTKIPAGDSLAIRNIRKQVSAISTDKRYIAKVIPSEIVKEFFNADFGRSFALTLKKDHATRNYKYAQLMVVQKSRSSSLMMLFLSDENGPAFYRNINSIFYTVKFK